MTATFAPYQATLTAREAAVAAIDTDLTDWFTRAPFADPIAGWPPTAGSPTSAH